MAKLYLIGIDAAPLWLIKKLSRRKGMEPFRKLLDGGHIIDMESVLPPMTGGAWPTIYTGLPPSEHGVPDFFVMRRDYTPELVYYDSKANPPFWKEIASKGGKCLVITPATDIHLPDYPDVDMITGFPLKARTNSRLLQSLMKKYGFCGEPDIEKEMKDGKMSEKEGARRFAGSAGARAKIAEEAIEKNDYDFVYVCFTETDRLQHFVLNMKGMEEYLLPVYSEIARYVKFVTERAEAEGSSVMIVSDHGAQPIKEKFLLNAWMVREGYAKLKDSVMESMGEGSVGSLSYGVREKLIKSKLRKAYDKLPHAAKDAVAKSMGRLLAGAGGGKYTRLHLFDFEMGKTRAFAAVSNLMVATIWINDSRFASGTVNGKEKAQLKKELSRKLMGIKDRNRKLMVNVWDGARYYGNTRKFIPADLLVEIRPGYMLDIYNFSAGSLFMEPEPPKRGDHTRLGIFGTYPERPKAKGNVFQIIDVHDAVLGHYGFSK